MPAACTRPMRSAGSMNGANAATNSDEGEISTAVRPDGTVCAPNVISVNGRATEIVPSSSAERGRRRTSANAARAALGPSAATKTTAATAVRAHTITGASKSSSAYLISR